MCSKSIFVLFGRRLRINQRSCRSHSGSSYLHGSSSEPLTYATLGEILEKSANKYPNRVAIKSVHEDQTLTYEQLITQADSFGSFLQSQGFKKGDRIGIWSHNSVAWVVTLAAAARTGLISVLLNPLYEKSELTHCIKKTGMKGILLGDTKVRDYYGILQQIVPELRNSKPGSLDSQVCPELKSVITSGKDRSIGAHSFEDIVTHDKSSSLTTQYLSPDDGCVIHLTSGTSGQPKAALGSHFAYVNNSHFAGKRLKLDEDYHRFCVQVPMFHALGSVVTVMTPLSYGSTLVLAGPNYSVDLNLKALYNEQCTVITGTPTMFVDILSRIGDRDPPPRLQTALTGGAPCSPELIRKMQSRLNIKNAVSLYGMTETAAGTFQSTFGESIDKIAETVGYIMEHIEAKVVDEEGHTVPFGTPGELLTRGYCNMMYYWDDEEKTKDTITEDGWLKSGDKFVLTPDGYGKIVGRKKDIIVRGGENIAPKEIEDVLDAHPDIIHSQVVGVPDERLGEELCAVLQVQPGREINVKDLSEFCSGKLPKFKTPRIFKFVQKYPQTTSGKIQKYKLKELIENGSL